jgi:hypothetical protein
LWPTSTACGCLKHKSTCDHELNQWTTPTDSASIEHELNYCIEDLARQISQVLTEQPPTSVDGFSDIDA